MLQSRLSDHIVLAVQAEKMQSSDLKTIVEIFCYSASKVMRMNGFNVLYPCDSVAKYGYT